MNYLNKLAQLYMMRLLVLHMYFLFYLIQQGQILDNFQHNDAMMQYNKMGQYKISN